VVELARDAFVDNPAAFGTAGIRLLQTETMTINNAAAILPEIHNFFKRLQNNPDNFD
jgi:hypothetical protein